MLEKERRSMDMTQGAGLQRFGLKQGRKSVHGYLEPELYDRIVARAIKNKRSIVAEVTECIEKIFEQEEAQERQRDLALSAK